jgi:hypothetical protein
MTIIRQSGIQVRPKQQLEIVLKSHGLTVAHNKKLKTRYETQAVNTRLLGFPAPAGGVVIPYFGVDGKQTNFLRIRFDDYTDPYAKMLGKKPLRYAQPKNSGVFAYFSPLVDWTQIVDDPGIPLLITEGEWKGSCACANGFNCIALGGVASWRGTKQGLPLLPELQKFDWQSRDVAIVFDSDAAQKKPVMAEENALAAALVSLGARVRIVRLPEVTA